MAWKLSIHNMKDHHALSVTDINDNFTTVIDEVGLLNEHNWTRRCFYRVDGFNVTTSVSPSTAYVINQSSVEKNPNEDLENDFDLQNLDPNGLGFKIPATAGWEHVPTQSNTQGEAMTITTKGGLLWIMASFQHSSGTNWNGQPLSKPPPNPATSLWQYDMLAINTPSPGAEYALQVDGALIPESILGSGENSVQDKAELRTTKDTLLPPNPNVEQLIVGRVRGSTPGCYGERLACVVEAVIPIAPGTHTIRLMARVPLSQAGVELPLTLETEKLSRDINPGTGAPITTTVFSPMNWCTNRELIVLELVR